MRKTNMDGYKPYQRTADYWESWKLVVAEKLDSKMMNQSELSKIVKVSPGMLSQYISLKNAELTIPNVSAKQRIDGFLGITEEDIKSGMTSIHNQTQPNAEEPVEEVVEEEAFNREATLMQLAQLLIRDQSIKKLLADNGISIEFQSIFARTDEQLKILMNLIAENDKFNKIRLNQYIGIRPTAGATTIHKAIVLMANKDMVEVILQKRHPSKEDEKIWVITTIRDKNLIEVPDEVEMATEDEYKKICSALEKAETDRARAQYALTSSKIIYDADYTG